MTSRYHDYSTNSLLTFCTAAERNGDPVPVDLIAELSERGVICSSNVETGELQFARNDALQQYIDGVEPLSEGLGGR